MKISLIGYGKMGKEIEKLCTQRGHEIHSIIDPLLGTDISKLKDTDIAIEFTQPSSVIGNLQYCIKNRIPIVCGTTGWHDRLEEIQALCTAHDGTVFHSSNFSIGVNLFWKISQYMMEIFDNHSEYGLGLHEIHHDQKKDAPSGTAVTLAQKMLEKSSRFKAWNGVDHFSLADNLSIPISSERTGVVPGTHTVEFKSNHDKITLTHEAFSRGGFVAGVVTAAEWLHGKKGFYSMEDLFKA